MATDLNAAMIQRMKDSGALHSAAVEAAFQRTPRHLFVPGVGLDLVYSGNALVTRSDPKLGITSSSSEVAIMAPMLEALRVEPGNRVLEVGAGTGYNAALLDVLVGSEGRVVTIDNQPEVVTEAEAHLAAAGRGRVQVVRGDGYAGLAGQGPYDRIIATASVRDIPLPWRDQLREGGVLVVPLRFAAGAQVVATFRRNGMRLESVEAVVGGFMPLRTPSQELEEPLKVAKDLDVLVAADGEGDAELMTQLLEGEPVLEPLDSYPGQAMFSLAGAIERDWIVIRPRGRNGIWQGLIDRGSRGLAVIWPVMLPVGANRASLVVYGSAIAGERLRQLLEQLAAIAVDSLRVDAVPSDDTPPAGNAVYPRPNFTYALSWRSGSTRRVGLTTRRA